MGPETVLDWADASTEAEDAGGGITAEVSTVRLAGNVRAGGNQVGVAEDVIAERRRSEHGSSLSETWKRRFRRAPASTWRVRQLGPQERRGTSSFLQQQSHHDHRTLHNSANNTKLSYH